MSLFVKQSMDNVLNMPKIVERAEQGGHYLHVFMLSTVLFAGAALYSEANYIYYVSLIAIVSTASLFYLFAKPKVISLLLGSGFLWWVISVFAMYLFYGLALPVYSEFNWDYVLFELVVIVNVVVWFIRLPEVTSVRILVRSAALASLAFCLFLAFNEASVVMSEKIRLGTSASGNVNTVGLWFGVLSVLTLYGVLIEKKILYALIWFLQIIFIVLTGSKKALIFIVVGVMLLSVLKIRFKTYKYIIPGIIVFGLFYSILHTEIFYAIMGQRVIDFLGQLGIYTSGAGYSHSTDVRMQMIQSGWKMFLESPLFGSGWFYFSAQSGFDTFSHNNYIELLVTYGLVGASLYYGMYLFVLKELYRRLRESDYAKLLFTLLIAVMLSDFGGVTFYESPRYYIVLFFAFVLINKKVKLQNFK